MHILTHTPGVKYKGRKNWLQMTGRCECGGQLCECVNAIHVSKESQKCWNTMFLGAGEECNGLTL